MEKPKNKIHIQCLNENINTTKYSHEIYEQRTILIFGAVEII
jgi:hypothetical protein